MQYDNIILHHIAKIILQIRQPKSSLKMTLDDLANKKQIKSDLKTMNLCLHVFSTKKTLWLQPGCLLTFRQTQPYMFVKFKDFQCQ